MNKLTIKALVIVSMIALSTLPVPAKPETFKVDPVHSAIFFKIKHAGVGYTYGMFFNPEGQFVVDQETPENSSVTVQVKATVIIEGRLHCLSLRWPWPRVMGPLSPDCAALPPVLWLETA